MMRIRDMKKARELLKRNVAKVDAEAVDYIDWDQFEATLEAMMNSDPTQEMILAVFGAHIQIACANRAKHAPRMKPTN
jgi:hypothetical protein